MADPTISQDIIAQIQTGLKHTQQRIDAAAKRVGKTAEDIELVAVTKYATIEQVKAIIGLGHLHLGESRGQQIKERVPLLDAWYHKYYGEEADPLHWHMIGHIQSNKIKDIAPNCSLIHAAGTLRLIENLQQWGVSEQHPVDILLQINISNEDQKKGMPPAAALHFAEQIDSMPFIKLRGLMGMASAEETPENTRPQFHRLKEIYDDIKKAGYGKDHFNILSMGMSHDFEIAIEEGANVIRVGSAIFDPENQIV